MIDISIPFSVDAIILNLNSIDKDVMLREIATNVMPMMRIRVHVNGQDSDGSPIGTYSKGYMKVRTGNYPETVVSKGKNKGQFRERKEQGQAGVFTKGRNQGQPRPTYNRSTDNNVILSLTRQMEQYMQVFETENGYGIGYSNELNYNKAIWNEKRYKKAIWSLAIAELDVMKAISERYITEKLND
ncbi:hypothetical protein CLV62_1255 [Dysgonomonas alginatilytica]|uniref:Uncharacterized protein n=1 Tax=Dysgonomonas alginatilytica TaxID=1605892 RepID=A0A2V3PJY2_9BACT|nr:hypothetical protein [Dysgonomonas alginatilytica]PXV61172.1 hypothetical protein CLV62_1255 [Dysgonomonas alginatilytica]